MTENINNSVSISALTKYVMDSSPEVNIELREKRENANPTLLFDDLFQSDGVKTNQWLYRKIGLCYYDLGLSKDKVHYCDYAYLSTSTNITDVISKYDTCPRIALLIICPNSLPVIDVNKTLQKYLPEISFNNEFEFIIPHNTCFKIDEKTDYYQKDFTRLVENYNIDECPEALYDIYGLQMIRVAHLSPVFPEIVK